MSWGVRVYIVFLAFIGVLGCGYYMSYSEAFPIDGVVPTYDAKNDTNELKQIIEEVTANIHRVTMIANQVREFVRMGPAAIIAHQLGLEKDLKMVNDSMKAVRGVMNETKSAESAWTDAFGSVENMGKQSYDFNDFMSLQKTVADTTEGAYKMSRMYASKEKREFDKEKYDRDMDMVQNFDNSLQAMTGIGLISLDTNNKINDVINVTAYQNILLSTAFRAQAEKEAQQATQAKNYTDVSNELKVSPWVTHDYKTGWK